MAKGKNKKQPIMRYLVGTLILVIILIVGINLNSNPIEGIVSDYIHHKQEIKNLLGPIESIDYTNKPYSMSPDKNHTLEVTVRGQDKSGVLTFNAYHKDNTWHIDNIALKTDDKVHKLSPLFVGEIKLYAASMSSPPLSEPVFITGENMYFELFLEGLKTNAPAHIVESLSLYNDNKELITSKDNIAEFHSENKDKLGIRFTNKLSDLSPGTYSVGLTFKDQNGTVVESFSQDFLVRPSKNNVFVKSVQYFLDSEMTQKVSPEFKPSQNIFLSLSLDGFAVKNSKISGKIDLEIKNSEGETIAYKPKFANFDQDFEDDMNIVINGKLQLKEPDIYLLNFNINDGHSQKISHTEKVLITF